MRVEVAFLERDEYVEHKPLFGGIQYIFKTATGRKLSVVRHKFSHGNECDQGLYELADITDGSVDVVQGYLTVNDVIGILVEELTEDTVIPNLLEVYEYDGDLDSLVLKNMSIKEALENDDNEDITQKTYHIINDDGTHTLIWKDGELVE